MSDIFDKVSESLAKLKADLKILRPELDLLRAECDLLRAECDLWQARRSNRKTARQIAAELQREIRRGRNVRLGGEAT